MTSKNGFGKPCSSFVLSKIKTWTLRFPTKGNRNACGEGTIVFQYDVKAKYRLIPESSRE